MWKRTSHYSLLKKLSGPGVGRNHRARRRRVVITALAALAGALLPTLAFTSRPAAPPSPGA